MKTNESPIEFYENYGSEWGATERRLVEKITATYKVTSLCSLLEGLSPERILDFGCGLGDNLDLLANHFRAREAVGLDISSTMIEHAKKSYSKYTFVRGGIEELMKYKVDLVTFIDVLEHLEDIPAILQAASKAGRYVAVKIPLEKTWLNRILNALGFKNQKSRFFESEGHLYEFNRSDVEQILWQAGLTILKARVDFMPKEALFSEPRKNRMKAKQGPFAGLKYRLFIILGRLPYSLIRPIFKAVDGSDFFVLCKS